MTDPRIDPEEIIESGLQAPQDSRYHDEDPEVIGDDFIARPRTEPKRKSPTRRPPPKRRFVED